MTNSNRHSRLDSSMPKQNLLDSFNSDQVIDWMSQNGKNIIYALLGLIALFLVVYRISSSNSSKAEKDYLQAANEFALFESSNPATDQSSKSEALQRLKSILASHSELHAAYGGAIAQTLLNRGQTAEAKPFAQATLERTQANNLPLYGDFSTATILIGEQEYKKALEKSLVLKQKMLEGIEQISIDSERSFGEILFAFNLLRIGMLQQQIGDEKAELQTWQEWKRYAGLDKMTKESSKVGQYAFRILIQQLAIGSIALPDYISQRETLLKK